MSTFNLHYETLVTEILNHNALMMVYSENSKNALYLFHQYTPKYKNENYTYQYRLSDFSASFMFYSLATEDGEKIRRISGIPIPHYLFEIMNSGKYYDDKELLITGDIEDFYEFYKIFKTYYVDSTIEIKKEEDTLILENIPVIFEIVGETDVRNESGILKKITLTFSTNKDNHPIVTFAWNEK